MTITIRFYAAARAAAGTSEWQAPKGTLAETLERLRSEFGPEFERVLSMSSILIDGCQQHSEINVSVHDGQVLDVLPPFAGG